MYLTWLSQSWKGSFVQHFSTQAWQGYLCTHVYWWRESLCMFMVPISLGCGAVTIVINPLAGLIEQQVSTCMMHVVSVVCMCML